MKMSTLWQLPAQTGNQMNSYVMRTAHGRLIVIDGGYDLDAGYLKGFLAALGNSVAAWFISHQHLDHVDALTEVLKKPGDLQVEQILGSLLPSSWIATHEKDQVHTTLELHEALEAASREVVELELGQVLEIDGVGFEVLGIGNPEITVNAINNSSLVMRVWDHAKSILFPGDLGVEGGRKLLEGPYRDRLRSDYVQMAHHGQNGVDEEFYQAVGASCCLWPTPLWLWDNDAGDGGGSGPWKTLEVRAWMDKLNIQAHHRLFNGLQEII